MSFAHSYYSTIGLIAIAEYLFAVEATAGDIAPVATLALVDDPAVAVGIDITLIVVYLLTCVIARHYVIGAYLWCAPDAEAVDFDVVCALLWHYAGW